MNCSRTDGGSRQDPVRPGADGDYFGPVCDQNAHITILKYIEIGKKEGRLVGGSPGPDTGYFVQPRSLPTSLPMPPSPRRDLRPVLAVIKQRTLTMLWPLPTTPISLTGGVFSITASDLERARRDFHVGNLYLNRKISALEVSLRRLRWLSGTCAKAGGATTCCYSPK